MASAGEPAPPAGIGAGVFRLFLAIRHRDARSDVRCFLMKRSVAEKGTRIGGE
jgi:hypothetical protein